MSHGVSNAERPKEMEVGRFGWTNNIINKNDGKENAITEQLKNIHVMLFNDESIKLL